MVGVEALAIETSDAAKNPNLHFALPFTMGTLYSEVFPTKTYLEVKLGHEAFIEVTTTSCTLYIGNVSDQTREEQIYELFSSVGPVKLVRMGLNAQTKQPCGFCFVEYVAQHQTELIHVDIIYTNTLV